MATETKNKTKIEAETEAETKIEAETKAKTKTKPKIEYEEIFVPKGYANDEPNLFVSVNGVNYLLPKGKTSKVPPHIAAAVKRSLRAQQRQDENAEKLLKKASQPVEL